MMTTAAIKTKKTEAYIAHLDESSVDHPEDQRRHVSATSTMRIDAFRDSLDESIRWKATSCKRARIEGRDGR